MDYPAVFPNGSRFLKKGFPRKSYCSKKVIHLAYAHGLVLVVGEYFEKGWRCTIAVEDECRERVNSEVFDNLRVSLERGREMERVNFRKDPQVLKH